MGKNRTLWTRERERERTFSCMTASTFFSNSLILELDCASCVAFLLCCSIQSHSPVCNDSRRGAKAYHVMSLPSIEVHLLARGTSSIRNTAQRHYRAAGLCVRRQTDPRIIRHANDDLLDVTAGTQNKQRIAPRRLRQSGLSSAQPRVLTDWRALPHTLLAACKRGPPHKQRFDDEPLHALCTDLGAERALGGGQQAQVVLLERVVLLPNDSESTRSARRRWTAKQS